MSWVAGCIKPLVSNLEIEEFPDPLSLADSAVGQKHTLVHWHLSKKTPVNRTLKRRFLILPLFIFLVCYFPLNYFTVNWFILISLWILNNKWPQKTQNNVVFWVITTELLNFLSKILLMAPDWLGGRPWSQSSWPLLSSCRFLFTCFFCSLQTSLSKACIFNPIFFSSIFFPYPFLVKPT